MASDAAASPDVGRKVIILEPYQEVPSAEEAAAVFARNGLISSRFGGSVEMPTDESHPDAGAEGLCRSVLQLGGLYFSLANFLRWRSDLLPGSYISNLRRLRFDCPPVAVSSVALAIRNELGPTAEEVAAHLSAVPVWNTPLRTAYRSEYRGEPVFVEVARDAIAEESFSELEKGLRLLTHPELTHLGERSVMTQFRDHVRNGESLARERSFLEALGHLRESRTEYPVPIPSLSSPSILCWPLIYGQPARQLIEKGDAKSTVLIASAILEQFLSLSIVDADLDLDAMVVRDGRLHFQRLTNPVSVLPRAIDTGVQYIAAVLAGNATRSAQTLIRLVISQPALDLEKRLMEQFSAIEPELKIKMWFPPSAGAFENNWRALAKIVPSRPLYLDCLHRSLVAAGYWNADAVAAGAPAHDAIAEAMWPAIGRLLRDRFYSLNRESLPEWAIGSGLLILSTLREVNRQVEELRESDFTVGVERDEASQSTRKGRSGLKPIVLAVLTALFLASVEWGGAAPEPWALLLKIVAAGALVAMFWTVSKIG